MGISLSIMIIDILPIHLLLDRETIWLLYSMNWWDLQNLQTLSKNRKELGYKSLELAECLYQVQGQNTGVWSEYPPKRSAKLIMKMIRGPPESTVLPQTGAETYTPAGQKSKNLWGDWK